MDIYIYGFPDGSVVKNLPAMQEPQETWVWSLGWEDPLGEEMATHSSILGWRILWTEEPGGLQSMGLQRVGHVWATEHSTTRARETRPPSDFSYPVSTLENPFRKSLNIISAFYFLLCLAPTPSMADFVCSDLPLPPPLQLPPSMTLALLLMRLPFRSVTWRFLFVMRQVQFILILQKRKQVQRGQVTHPESHSFYNIETNSQLTDSNSQLPDLCFVLAVWVDFRWLNGKEVTCNAGDPGSIPGLGRSPGEGKGNPFQYSCLENSMDRGAEWATVYGVTKTQTWLREFHFFSFHLI